jgi:hypothetical protein
MYCKWSAFLSGQNTVMTCGISVEVATYEYYHAVGISSLFVGVLFVTD